MRLFNNVGQQAPRRAEKTRSTLSADDVQKHQQAKELTKQITRRWKVGDIYSPHDLSGVEMMKWKRRSKPEFDSFDLLALNPVDAYRVCGAGPE